MGASLLQIKAGVRDCSWGESCMKEGNAPVDERTLSHVGKTNNTDGDALLHVASDRTSVVLQQAQQCRGSEALCSVHVIRNM